LYVPNLEETTKEYIAKMLAGTFLLKKRKN